ncbi:MAG: glutathione S-transferase [Pseudomonadota bacterium]
MSDALPILYSFRRCPYAMRGRMALAVSGQTVSLREVILKNKPAEMIGASAKGTVPVLVRADGVVIDESIDVMDWALNQHDPEGWLAPDLPKQKALIAENDGPFKHHLDRYKYATRYEGADALTHRVAGMAFLDQLSETLGDKANIFRDARALSDIAIFPFVRQFRIADPEWFDRHVPANLVAWLNRHMESDLFQSVMGKYAPWQSGEEGVIFPA